MHGIRPTAPTAVAGENLPARPPVVTFEEWQQAREDLREEKALTHALDALAARRRRLPMARLTTDHTFTAPDRRRNSRDARLVLMSRAPQEELVTVRARIGWSVRVLPARPIPARLTHVTPSGEPRIGDEPGYDPPRGGRGYVEWLPSDHHEYVRTPPPQED